MYGCQYNMSDLGLFLHFHPALQQHICVLTFLKISFFKLFCHGRVKNFLIVFFSSQGMVLVSSDLNPKACLEFEATIFVLFHVTSISKGFQATVHIGNVCQTVVISHMDTVGSLIIAGFWKELVL